MYIPWSSQISRTVAFLLCRNTFVFGLLKIKMSWELWRKSKSLFNILIDQCFVFVFSFSKIWTPALEVCHSSTAPPCGCGNIASVDHLSDNDWFDNDFSIDTDLVVHFLVHTFWWFYALVLSHTCHQGSTSHQSRLFGRLSTGLGAVVLIDYVTRAILIHVISVQQCPIN